MKDIKKDTTTQKRSLINPNNMPSLIVPKKTLEKQILCLRVARALPPINTMENYRQAGDVLILIKKKSEEIEKKRRAKTDPLLKNQRKIKAAYDALLNPLMILNELIRKDMLAFILAEQKKKDNEQLLLEEKAKADNPQADAIVVDVVNNIKTQRGEEGLSTVRKRWTFKVEDQESVPREFLMVNEVRVRQAIAGGCRGIAGIKVYQEESISTRS